TRKRAVFEVNRMFDDASQSLLARGCGLRVREIRPVEAPRDDSQPDAKPGSGILTFKGPEQPAAVKTREELETEVEDAVELTKILSRLGFQERVRYEKRRETWSLAGCEVAIDELPRLGWYVEIEGPDARSVEAVRARLELDAAARVS